MLYLIINNVNNKIFKLIGLTLLKIILATKKLLISIYLVARIIFKNFI